MIFSFKDKEFQKLILLSKLKYKNPIIYELLEKYDKNETKCEPNIEKVHKQMIDLIKNKCINILQSITGQDFSEDETQIVPKLKSALNKLTQELNQFNKLCLRFDLNLQKYQSVGLFQSLN